MYAYHINFKKKNLDYSRMQFGNQTIFGMQTYTKLKWDFNGNNYYSNLMSVALYLFAFRRSFGFQIARETNLNSFKFI